MVVSSAVGGAIALTRRSRAPLVAASAASLTTWGLAGALLLGSLVVYLGHAWALLGYPFGIDQGEGYDAYSGWLIHLGRWIYSDNSLYPYYSSNYPPLYSYLVSVAMAWLGRSMGPARLVSLLATLGAGALIAAVVWRGQRRAGAAACTALLFFASSYVFHTTPLARVNATALFFALAALAVLEGTHGRRLLLVGALLLAAVFTKQTALDAVAAAGLWLAVSWRWRDALALLGGVGVVGIVLAAALELLSGGNFLTNVVVGNVNPWSIQQAVAYYGNFLALHAVIVALAAVQTWRELRSGGPSLFAVYFLVSALAAASAGKWGAGESYFLAPLAAGCVLSGRLLASVRGLGPRQAALGAAILLQAMLVARGPVDALLPWAPASGFQERELGWTPTREDVAAGGKLLGYVQRARGPVLAEDPGFVLASSRPIVGNATHLRNLWEAGVWADAALVADVAERRFEYVILDAQLYPPPVLEAIGRYYYLFDSVPLRHHTYQVFARGGEKAY